MKLRRVIAAPALFALAARGQSASLLGTLQQLEEQSWRAWKAQDAGFFQSESCLGELPLRQEIRPLAERRLSADAGLTSASQISRPCGKY